MYLSLKRAIAFTTVLLLLALTSCAPSALGRAKQGALVSYEVYQGLSSQVVEEIPPLVEKARAGTLTEEEREQLRILDKLSHTLNKYAAAHNAFVASLRVWEASNQQPGTAILLQEQMFRMINEAIDLAVELGLQVPTGLR